MNNQYIKPSYRIHHLSLSTMVATSPTSVQASDGDQEVESIVVNTDGSTRVSSMEEVW